MTADIIEIKDRQIKIQARAPYKLPIQVLDHFEGADDATISAVINCYNGDNKEPSFEEWLEAYQHSKLFKSSIVAQSRSAKLREALDEQEIKFKELNEDPNVDEKELKKAKQELNRLSGMLANNDDFEFVISKELTKAVQETLKRKAPKQQGPIGLLVVNPQEMGNFLSNAEDELRRIDGDEL